MALGCPSPLAGPIEVPLPSLPDRGDDQSRPNGDPDQEERQHEPKAESERDRVDQERQLDTAPARSVGIDLTVPDDR